MSISGRIHGDSVTLIEAVSAEIGRIHERCARSVQLGDERVVSSTSTGLEGTRGREVSRACCPRYVNVSGRIYGDGDTVVVAISAEIGRIRERRIDNKRPAWIVFAYLE